MYWLYIYILGQEKWENIHQYDLVSHHIIESAVLDLSFLKFPPSRSFQWMGIDSIRNNSQNFTLRIIRKAQLGWVKITSDVTHVGTCRYIYVSVGLTIIISPANEV